MAIRVRRVEGRLVALCAACTSPQEGDLYLDDEVHHALTTKFGLDFASEGLMNDALADPVLAQITLKTEDADSGVRR
jgi:hypothetical protein